MPKKKRFESWRLHMQPEYFKEAWRRIQLEKPGHSRPGEIEIVEEEGPVKVYHVRHHHRRATH